MLRQQNPSDVEVAITPEELEGLDEASIQGLYNQRVAEERARNAREVHPAMSLLVAVHDILCPRRQHSWSLHILSCMTSGIVSAVQVT